MTSAIWYRALSLVAGAAALGLVANAVRPGGVALASFAPPTECKGPHEGKAVPEDLAPADAAGLCGQPGVVVADTRAAGAFAEGHVAGAVHLPCDAGEAAGEALAHFERAQRIVVYGATSEDARPVAESLRRRHPDARVQVLAGGFAAWSSAGLACASGPCDECKTAATGGASGGGQSANVAASGGGLSANVAASAGGQSANVAASAGGQSASVAASVGGQSANVAASAPSGAAATRPSPPSATPQSHSSANTQSPSPTNVSSAKSSATSDTTPASGH